MKIKNIYLIIVAIFSLGLWFNYANIAQAEFRAGTGRGNIEVTCGGGDDEECGSDVNKLQLVGFRGNLGISVRSRPFNFTRSDNGRYLTNNAIISTGTSLTYSHHGSAIGEWSLTGGGYDTPDMDGRKHIVPGPSLQNASRNPAKISVNPPRTTDPKSITGTGAVTCDNTTKRCSTTGEGRATIRVTFPGGSVGATSEPKYPNQDSRCSQTQRVCDNISTGGGVETDAVCEYRTFRGKDGSGGSILVGCSCPNGGKLSQRLQIGGKPGNLGGDAFRQKYICTSESQQTEVCREEKRIAKDDCGQDRENISYSDYSTYIYLTVVRPNTAPEVTQNNPTNISTNTAQLNWTYKDKENDPQLKADIELSTDPQFPKNNKTKSYSLTGGGNSYKISQLIPGTKYYARIKVHSRGTLSDLSNVKEFTTLSNPNPNLSDFSCGVTRLTTSPGKYNTVNVNWNYTGPDQDALSLSIRAIKTSGNPNGTAIITPVNNASKTGNRNIGVLEAGTEYIIRIAVTDIYNTHITNQVKYCDTIKLDQRPPGDNPNNNPTTPLISCTNSGLSNNNLTNINVTLTNITGNYDWVVKRDDGDSTAYRSGSNSTIPNQLLLDYSGLSDGRYQPWVQITSSGRTISSTCGDINISSSTPPNNNTGGGGTPTTPPGGGGTPTTPPGGGGTTTTPTVSCSIDGGRQSVSASNPNISITATLNGITGSYNWEAGVNTNNKTQNSKNGTSTATTQQIGLEYKGFDFGRYQPWVKITTSGTTVEAICPAITNFGSSQIREVNP